MKAPLYRLNRTPLFVLLAVFLCSFATSVFAGGYFTVDFNDGQVYSPNGDFVTTAIRPPEHMVVNFIILECLADKLNDAGNEEFEVAITHDEAGTDVVEAALWWREASADLAEDFNSTDGVNYDTHLYLFDIPDTRLWNVYTYYLRTKVINNAPAETWGKAYIFYGNATIPESMVGHGRNRKQINVPNGQHYWNAGDFVTTAFPIHTNTVVRYVTMFCLDDNNDDAGAETFEVAICASSDGNDVLTSAQITDNFENNGSCDGHKYSFDFPDVDLPPGTYYLRTKAISGVGGVGPIRAWGGAQLYSSTWSNYTYKKMTNPPDVDKDDYGHENDPTCWQATAANMLAAAGYGTGANVQARADSIYVQMNAKYGLNNGGWPDVAMKWWLSSGHNTWTTNPYIWVGVRGNRTVGIPWSNSAVPQIVGNKIRMCEYVGIGFFPNTGMGHVTAVWGDSGCTAENYDWPIQNNPEKIIMCDSDVFDIDGLLQTYTYTRYNYSPTRKAWKLNYSNNTRWVRCLSTLARSTIDPLGKYVRRQRIIGSYKITKPGIFPDATQLHYVVGPQSGTLLLYDTYIDWDTNSVPTVQVSIGTPKELTVNWDLSDNPIPFGSTITITTEMGSADGGGIWYKNVGFPGIYANIPDFGMDGLHNQLGSSPYDPNDPDMTGGFIYGSMDVTDGDGNDGEFRWVEEYDFDQDPEWHNIIVSPHPEATEVYQISNLRFGHAYGLPDDTHSLWTFDEWWSIFPGPYELIPAGPPLEFELNWAGRGLIPYPTSNWYAGSEVPPPRTFDNSQNLQGVWHSDSSWGDFDNDGDLDLVICGKYPYGGPDTRVTLTYENQNGTLVQKAQADLPGITNESGGGLAWGDYDGDGDLDLAMAGLTDTTRIARIYENDGTGTLTHDTSQVLTGVGRAALAWGDYDNDGDLDLVVTGYDGADSNSILYKNDPLGTLTADATTVLTGVRGGSADWADIDGDADMDLVLTGYDGSSRRIIFYENNPVGTLVDDSNHGLPGVNLSDVAFGDYDNDGDMDVAITGDGSNPSPTRIARVYENDGSGAFTDTSAGLLLLYRSSLAWGDYDNDGDLDLALCGYDGGALYTKLYENTGSGFSLDYSVTGVREGSVNFADVNDDGDLDFFMTGADWSTTYARLYTNEGGLANISPSAPNSLTCTLDDVNDGILLEWNGAEDDQTPDNGLYYAVRVGTSPGEHDILSGTYGTPLMGNRGQANQLLLKVPTGSYYWSVKTIDSGFRTSDWAIEKVCHYCPGSVDLDCDVEFYDFAVMANAWLAELALLDPNYNELCDISKPPDEVIDEKDLYVLTENWLLNK